MDNYGQRRSQENYMSDFDDTSSTTSDDSSLLSPSANSPVSLASYVRFLNGVRAGPSTSTQAQLSEELFTDSMIADQSRESSTIEQTPLPTIPTPAPIETFDWVPGTSTTRKQPFQSADRKGWNVEFNNTMIEIDFWKLVFPKEILEKIVLETNHYANKIIAATTELSRRQKNFKPITDNEMIRYLVIRILMGIDNKPELSHYWSRDPILRNLVIPQIMSSDRFFEIQRYFHLCNDEDEGERAEDDKLHKVREIWTMAMNHFKTLKDPGESISVDESLTKFRGRLGWIQFIPSKRSRFGIKSFNLTDEDSGLILDSKIYVGKNGPDELHFCKKKYGHGGATLLTLCEPYLNRNRTIFADNYFTSPVLAEYLLKQKSYLCGTLRSNRKNIPRPPKLRKGEIATFCCEKENNEIMVEFWRDKRIVRMISTGLPHEVIETKNARGTVKRKLRSIDEYNHNARGTDLADMFIGYYDSARKTMKWSTKLFFRLLELFIYNSFVIMRQCHPKKPFLDFRLNLAKQLLEYTGGIPAERENRVPRPDMESVSHNRLTRRCFPAKSTSRRCIVCSKQGKQTRTIYFCEDCEVPLCAVPCFKTYHTEKKF